jgi:hypothetical protein
MKGYIFIMQFLIQENSISKDIISFMELPGNGISSVN